MVIMVKVAHGNVNVRLEHRAMPSTEVVLAPQVLRVPCVTPVRMSTHCVRVVVLVEVLASLSVYI